jgi:DNA-binding NtrC family response regulator
VFLPAVEDEPSQPRDMLPLKTPEGRGELILVVEDEASIRNIVATVLGQHGYRVLSCDNGFEAIALFNAQSAGVSLVITDLDMPKLGGVALANALMQIRPGLRLLVMSGGANSETDSSTMAEAQKLAHAFLAKPFGSEALLDTVHRVLYPAERSLAAAPQPSA